MHPVDKRLKTDNIDRKEKATDEPSMSIFFVMDSERFGRNETVAAVEKTPPNEKLYAEWLRRYPVHYAGGTVWDYDIGPHDRIVFLSDRHFHELYERAR